MKIQKMATANNEEQRGNCRKKLINIILNNIHLNLISWMVMV